MSDPSDGDLSRSSDGEAVVSRPPRPRRRRSTTESLLSIVLLLEAILLFFVTLVLFGLKTLPPAIAFGGGAAAVVVILITIGLMRWPIGFVLGWLIQAGLIALGLLNPVMYVVGAGFAAFWTWCFVRGRQIDRKRLEFLAAHPEAAATSAAPEGDTP
ncbi:MAG: DUF4233 domain-containing protein [Leifsonia sp.]|nr:DUF4233 domain-containing protein [Leifsonia sp.]